MSRTVDQILAEERIEISPRLIRTPDSIVTIGDSWILHEYHYPDWSGWYGERINPVAIAALIGAVWLLARPIPENMPWLIPVAFAAAVAATWSIGRSLLARWLTPSTPQTPSRGITFSIAGSEGAVMIFQSDDENEIKLVKQKLEQTLLSNQ